MSFHHSRASKLPKLRPITRSYDCTHKYSQGHTIAAIHVNGMLGWTLKDFLTSSTDKILTVNVKVGTPSPISRGVIQSLRILVETSYLRMAHLDDGDGIRGLTIEFQCPLCDQAQRMLTGMKFMSKSLIEQGIWPKRSDVPDVQKFFPLSSDTSPGRLRHSHCRPCTSDDEERDPRARPHLPTKAELGHIDNFIEALDTNNLHSDCSVIGAPS